MRRGCPEELTLEDGQEGATIKEGERWEEERRACAEVRAWEEVGHVPETQADVRQIGGGGAESVIPLASCDDSRWTEAKYKLHTCALRAI